MSRPVLVAGATGYLGRHLVAELHRRGHPVRALVRSRSSAEQPGPYGAPSLAGLVDEWVVAQVTEPGAVDGVCDGVDRVVSALGVTRQKASPWQVDFLGNLRLLEQAEVAGVQSFLFVNVLRVESGTSLTMRSKAAFREALRRSAVASQIVNPSGYFSDMSDFVSMARSGFAPQIGSGENRINPIHAADLAVYCADRVTGPAGEWDVGGPDVLTYREIEELAFAAVGKPPRILPLPAGVTRPAVWFADRLGPRAGNLTRFFVEGLVHDAVGEPFGDHHLRDHFRSLA